MLEALSYLSLLGDNPLEVALTFLRSGGVFLFLFLLYFVAWKGWVSYVGGLYASKRKFVLLAIDIPRVNEQSMKAVEQIITNLHGVHKGPGKKDVYWDGVSEDVFSLEIVSIDGYIQYFVRCDDYNEDLVKSAFFAQYPDAEIIEVQDYTENVPHTFPDEEMDMWGTEFVLTNSGSYPIKTYDHFEHSLTGVFADPMAAILESLNRLRPGEQVWMQILLTPLGSELRDEGLDEVNKLIGKSVAKKSRLGALGKLPIEFFDEARRQMFATDDSWLSSGGGGGDSESNFSNLTTGEQIVVEEVQKKISRLAFSTKFRMVYIAPREVMSGSRVVGAVFGSLKQFNTLDLNGFTAGRATTSSPSYVFVQRRQNKKKTLLMSAYRSRDTGVGDNPYPMSTTEIATIFHFPVDTVRAPLVSRTASKKSEPPAGLPLEQSTPFDALRAEDAAGRNDENRSTVEGVAQQNIPQALNIPAAPTMGGQLHSMPGLPPGVRPVQQQSVQTQALPQQQGDIPQKINVPMQPTVQPPLQQMPAEQTPIAQTPPPDYFAPQQFQAPVQQQAPPKAAPQKKVADQEENAAPPMNLPIG